MPDDEERNQAEAKDLISDEISFVSISRNIRISRKSENVGCLCYVYAGVFRKIEVILGVTTENNGSSERNGPGSKEAIKSMINALAEIREKLRRFKNNRNWGGCPKKYHILLSTNIDDLIPILNDFKIKLICMNYLYNSTKPNQALEDLDVEQSDKTLWAREQYLGYLTKCCDYINDINDKIVWWHEELSPVSCMDQQATG